MHHLTSFSPVCEGCHLRYPDLADKADKRCPACVAAGRIRAAWRPGFMWGVAALAMAHLALSLARL